MIYVHSHCFFVVVFFKLGLDKNHTSLNCWFIFISEFKSKGEKAHCRIILLGSFINAYLENQTLS